MADPEEPKEVPDEVVAEPSQRRIFADQRRELTTARMLTTKAITRVRELMANNQGNEIICEVRAGLTTILDYAKRLAQATRTIMKSELLTEEARETEIAKDLEYEMSVSDIRFEIITFLRRHDPESFEDQVSRRESNSIQHDKTIPDEGRLNSTMTSKIQVVKNSWKEILQRVPKFEGDPTKFRRWRNAFELHIDSTSMDPLEKFELMLKTLSGRALKCLESREVNAENYESARDTVFDRFSDIVLAEEQYVNSVIKRCGLCLKKEIITNQKFVDFVEDITQAIESLMLLGNSVEGMSPFAATMIMQSLTDDLRKDFDKAYRAVDEDERPCRLEALLEFLNEEKKQAERLKLVAKNTAEAASEKSKKFKSGRFSKAPNAQQFRRFDNRRFSPAGPSGSMSSEHSFAVATNPIADQTCIFCAEKHDSKKCRKVMPPEERRKCATTKNACYKCLNRNHRVDKCKAKGCARCGARHHELLCLKVSTETATAAPAVSRSSNATSVNAVKIANVSERRLPTGYVEILSDQCESIGRIVLDTGSQKTLISNKFADLIKARTVGTDSFFLQAVGQTSPKRCKGRIVEITLKSRFSNNHLVIQATALPSVVEGSLPEADFTGNLKPIADLNEGQWSSEINVLIGVDYLYPIVGQAMRKIGGFVAFETLFGYFLCGTGQHQEIQSNDSLMNVIKQKRESWTSSGRHKEESTVSLAVAVKSKYEPDDISFMWETEVLGIEPYFKENDEAPDEEMRQFFRETTTRDSDGRYVVHLPFKQNLHTLGDNRELTERRLRSFLAQARKNPALLEAVDAEMHDLLNQGFIELTESPKLGEQSHYLPLLAVVKKQATANAKMKVRVVNDASARSRNAAGLNDVLFQGENLIAEIISVILQFRQLSIAITADIERAYLQFKITPEHRKFLRFLWPLGISKNPKAKFKEMQSCRLSFGLISAPFQHCAGVRLHLENEIARRPEHSELLEFVKRYFYVDDLIAGSRDVEEGKKVVEILYDSFKAGCFPLKKWSTNSPELGSFIQEKYPDSTVTCDDENFKFLGVRWNQRADSLHIDASKTIEFFKTSAPSKRSLLKGASQVFDPIGIAAPILLGFKRLLQKHWQKKLDWDTPLVDADLQEYQETIERLVNVSRVKVKRNFAESKEGQSASALRELHVFCDASLLGYGCVAYARDITDPRNVKVTFIMAKGRVAPLKGEWSIHRLELIGAITATRIAKKIVQSTNRPFESVNFWCDNACVLAWIRDKPERWKSFVENRIKEIQSNSEQKQWRYIRTAHNPADLISRFSPLDSEELVKFWLSGPSWLSTAGKPENHTLNPEQIEREVSNEKRSQCFVSATTVTTGTINLRLTSSWGRTVRVMSYVLRWRKYRRSLRPQWLRTVTADEWKETELEIIRRVQKQYFADELRAGLNDLSKKSQIYQYSPFLDSKGIIRCRSRLSNLKEVSFDVKNPIILPGESQIVGLYVRWTHEKLCLHAGSVQGILQRLRRRFLILRARRAANKALSACQVCRRFDAKPASEETPDLPSFRMETCPAFSVTGVDAAGPLTIKNRDGNKVSAFIMLFTCPVSRAVRLELVENLGTYEFLLAMRRFYNRNPTVTQFFSDNAASFRRAAKEVKAMYQLIESSEMQSFLAQNAITWKFCVARAPWRNAFTERMVGTVKRPLRKILGRNIPTFRELETILTDIEKIVNDRPLTCVSTNPDELLPIRPSDLLYGNQVQPALPDLSEVVNTSELRSPIILSARWKHQQDIMNAFWKRYRREYLVQLKSNLARAPVKSRPLAVGDIVILDDPAASRAYWPIARVHSLCGGEGISDGRKRTCIIRMPSGKLLKRPIQLLYKIDVEPTVN